MADIQLKLKIWRQAGPEGKGDFRDYDPGPVSTDMSFLEMLDVVNERLTLLGEEPVAFDHDGVNVFCEGELYCSLEDLGIEPPKKGEITIFGGIEIQGRKTVIWPIEFEEI